MTNITKAQADSLVTLHDGIAVTNTIIIAEHFGKEHKHVLEAVRALIGDCPLEFHRSNFRPREYYDSRGQAQPMYELTEKGFAMLAMGFVGPRFVAWKIAFLEEFERRGRELMQRDIALSAAARVELLRANPLWAAIARYKGMGLTNGEVARLTGHGKDSVRKNLRRMEACGVIAPPPNLAAMQQLELPLIGGAQ